MCTVTWTGDASGHHLFMNRDELHTRGHALPPRVQGEASRRFIAPTDTDAGGTWIAANEHGVIACLLNNFPAMLGMAADGTIGGRPGPGMYFRGEVSRGLIPPALMAAATIEELDSLVRSLDRTQYSPFFVFALGPAQPGAANESAKPIARLYRWDGAGDLEVTETPALPVSTSSFMAKQVLENRSRVFRDRLGIDPDVLDNAVAANTRNDRRNTSPEALIAYHRSHVPERGPYSVCVHRDDAGTKSLSHVTVTSGRVHFAYIDGPPCEDGPPVTVSLPRAGRSVP